MAELPVMDAAPALILDRRRPGRPAQVSPELIPLLRGEFVPPTLAAAAADVMAACEEEDQLAPARGIAAAVLFSAAAWAPIIAGVWWLVA